MKRDGCIKVSVEHLLVLWPILHKISCSLVGVLRLEVGVANGDVEWIVVAFITHQIRNVGQRRLCYERRIVIDVALLELSGETDVGVEECYSSPHSGIHIATLIVLTSAFVHQWQFHLEIDV